MKKNTFLGVCAAIIATIIWGSWFPVSRIMLRDETLSAEDIGILRYSIAGSLLIPVVFRYGFKAGSLGWRGSFALSVTLGFPYLFVLLNGLEYVPASHGSLFGPGVYPALALLLGALILKDKINWIGLCGFAFIGAGVLAVGSAAIYREIGDFRGYGLFLVGASMWAAYTILARIAKIGAFHITAIVSVLSLVLFVPPALVWGEINIHRLPIEQLLFQLTFHGLINGLIATFTFTYAVQSLGVARAAAFMSLIPCHALVLSAPIAGEIPGLVEIGGVAAVSLGIVLVNDIKPWQTIFDRKKKIHK